MILLVVDNNLERLWDLVYDLRQLSPENTVEYTHDPLMAARFVANKHVDLLLCECNMKPADGVQLERMVHNFQPHTKTVLISDREELAPEADIELYDNVRLLKRPLANSTLKMLVAG